MEIEEDDCLFPSFKALSLLTLLRTGFEWMELWDLDMIMEETFRGKEGSWDI
jgi:hypothetical protein